MSKQGDLLFGTYQEFLLFLYMHVAKADLILHLSEEEIILSKMSKMYPHIMDIRGMFGDVKGNYESYSAKEVEYIIKQNFEQFSILKANAELVFDDLFEIIYADDLIHDLEIKEMKKIKAYLLGEGPM